MIDNLLKIIITIKKMKRILLIIAILWIQGLFAQIDVYESKSYGKHPKIMWFRKGNDSINREFTIYRADLKTKKFRKINTKHFLMTYKKDTLLYYVEDTTLVQKGMYQYYIKVKPEKGDSLTSAAAYAHNLGMIDPPTVVKMDAVGQKDKKSIKITWQLNYNFSIRKLTLMRSDKHDSGYVKVADLPAKATEYVDFVPLSNHNYFYFLIIADFFGYQYPSVPVPAYTLYKSQAVPPQNLSLKQEGSKVVLTWENADKNLSGYRVYRSINGLAFHPLHEMQTSALLKESFTDQLPDISDLKSASYYVVNYSDAYVPSKASATVTAYFTPKYKTVPPADFDIVKTSENQIKFLWTIPEKSSVKSYRIYMEQPEKKLVTKTDIPAGTTYFDDTTNYAPGSYVFAIKSVGADGKESRFATKASVQILPPHIKLVVDAKKEKHQVRLQWKAIPGKQIQQIVLYKQEGNHPKKFLKRFANQDIVYHDKLVKKGKVYRYIFKAKTTNGTIIPLQTNVTVSF